MKRKFLYVLLIFFLAGLTVLVDSCKKEDYPEGDFIKQLKRGWYVNYFQFTDESNFSIAISFDGDSVVNFNEKEYFISDPNLCQIFKIENIQYWTFTEYNNELHLQTKDLCGGVNNYIFSYNNYQSSKQMTNHDMFVMYADVTLIGQDTTISFYQFILEVIVTDPSRSHISFEYESSNTGFNLSPSD